MKSTLRSPALFFVLDELFAADALDLDLLERKPTASTPAIRATNSPIRQITSPAVCREAGVVPMMTFLAATPASASCLAFLRMNRPSSARQAAFLHQRPSRVSALPLSIAIAFVSRNSFEARCSCPSRARIVSKLWSASSAPGSTSSFVTPSALRASVSEVLVSAAFDSGTARAPCVGCVAARSRSPSAPLRAPMAEPSARPSAPSDLASAVAPS